jgi:hypothetical protein
MEAVIIDWDFKPEDWNFERSSGYPGYRNIHTGEWLFSDEHNRRRLLLEEFEKFKSLSQFFEFDLEEEYARTLFEDFKNQGFSVYKKEN